MNLTTLNNEQLKAVTTTEGPLLVLAGAGSGKTRVLTTRIAYLIEELGVSPYNILAITFTNKAAKEMKMRIFNMLGSVAYDIQISTFHSFGLTIMKENYALLGYKQNFTILDSDDTLTLIKKIMKDLNIDIKEYNPKAIRNHISGAKNQLFSPEQYENYANTDFDSKVVLVYRIYQERLKVNNSLDFDDLLMQPIILFKNNIDVLKKYQQRFMYILVDEYQDTNEAQYKMIKMLGTKYQNVCVVGDESQSIYSFRGSNYRNILNFEKDYPNAEVILLEENYRSTKNILNAANDVIKHNKERKDKKLWTENEVGDKITYYRASDEKEEALYVDKQIKDLLSKDVKEKDIAVLYRTNAQSRNIEEALLRDNIPYKVVGSFYFYNRREIKDLIAYLKILYNTDDDLNLLRIINVPKRGIGLKAITNLQQKANDLGVSLYDAISSGKELEFKKTIEKLLELKEKVTLTELVDQILDITGIREELKKEKSIEADIRLENLEEFKSITKNFEEQLGYVSLEEFLMEISLVSDVEEHKNNNDVITLMTVHSAKGLEFEYVFVIGLEEGLFPHNNSMFELSGLEEERRLFYVALTRAKKRLWLVNAHHRTLFGMDSYNPISRFINEISEEYIDKIQNEVASSKTSMQFKNIDTSVTYNVGDMVSHDTFGKGVVVSVEKQLLTIAFPHPYGVRKIISGHKSIRKD